MPTVRQQSGGVVPRSVNNPPTESPDNTPRNWTVGIMIGAAVFLSVFIFCCWCAGENDDEREEENEENEEGIEMMDMTNHREERNAVRIVPLIQRSVTPPMFRPNMVCPSILVPLNPQPHFITNAMVHVDAPCAETSFMDDWTSGASGAVSATIDETVMGGSDSSDDQPGTSFRRPRAQKLQRQTSKANRILGSDQPEAPGPSRKKWMEKIGISFDY